MPGDVTDLDVCPHCGGEVRFGERQHHLDEACVPEVVVRTPGFAGRMPSSPWVRGMDMTDVMRRFEEAVRRSSPR